MGGWIRWMDEWMDGGTYVNGPLVHFGEVQSGISVTVDVSIQVRLQFRRRREEVQ